MKNSNYFMQRNEVVEHNSKPPSHIKTECEHCLNQKGGGNFIVPFFSADIHQLFICRLNYDQPNAPNQAYYSEYERHNSEIAAFHVDRLLGLRRALPTCGRKINLREFYRISEPKLKETYFTSLKPDENICLTGNCEMYCDQNHPVCADGDELEVGRLFSFTPSWWINVVSFFFVVVRA